MHCREDTAATVQSELLSANLKLSIGCANKVVEAIPGVILWLRSLGRWAPRRGPITIAAKVTTKGKLLFSNGVLDMATGVLSPFTAEVVSMLQVPRPCRQCLAAGHLALWAALCGPLP